MFEAISRERLVTTQQVGKGLVGVVVIFDLSKLAVAL
jgi:hypothetical protein